LDFVFTASFNSAESPAGVDAERFIIVEQLIIALRPSRSAPAAALN